MRFIDRHPIWSPANIMQRDFDDSVWNVLPRVAGQLSRRASEWIPATDIQEDGERFVLRSDLPGLKAEDIDITVENELLSIKGERKFKRSEENGNFRRFERVQGSFERSFNLPDAADPEQISASCKDGVLEVVIGKRESIQPKRIAVNS
ncbi:MAG: Hsp20/alpha crystallin family protein [Gammaproteobacteria bacterium]|nr:Hsp20/alpha crystallin family protein [Gammaproteobacteria bacterium]